MPEQNIPNDTNTSLPPEGLGEGQFDLDKIFGSEGGTSSKGVVKKDIPSGGDGLPPVESDIFKGVTSVGRTDFKGQNDNMPKNPQDVIAKLQSERDKALSQVKDWEAQASGWKTANDFLGQLESDADVRRAFMHELEPELVKPKNPYDLIQEALKGEFKDFTPNPDEANIFGSQTWVYNQRAQELLTEAKTKYAIPESLKGLREKRKADATKAHEGALKEKQEIMTQLQWQDATWGGFTKWMQSSAGLDFAKIYQHLLRQSNTQPKPLSTQRGLNYESNTGSPFEELNQFFGTTIN